MPQRALKDDCYITIHVEDAKGKPARGVKVYIDWAWHGWENQRTDSTGNVRFWIPFKVISGASVYSVKFTVEGKRFEYSDVDCGKGYVVSL